MSYKTRRKVNFTQQTVSIICCDAPIFPCHRGSSSPWQQRKWMLRCGHLAWKFDLHTKMTVKMSEIKLRSLSSRACEQDSRAHTNTTYTLTGWLGAKCLFRVNASITIFTLMNKMNNMNIKINIEWANHSRSAIEMRWTFIRVVKWNLQREPDFVAVV